ERLRLSATVSLLERPDVLTVASVSSIYGLTARDDYQEMSVELKVGDEFSRTKLLRKLVEMQFERNDTAPERGQFRVRGDVVDIFLAHREEFIRVEFWGDSIDSLSRCELLTGKVKNRPPNAVIFPPKHFVLPQEKIELALGNILEEMKECVKNFERQGKLVEAQRLYQRVNCDVEMMREIGYCQGIENYSRHLAFRAPGSRPSCLLDFYPEGFLTIIDESHVTIPQLQAMYKADRNRKQVLVDYGFRLPSALDNRPLTFEEFMDLVGDVIFVSATPGKFELDLSGGKVVEQVVRPTGLLDPPIEVRPLSNQIDDVMEEIRKCAESGGRTLVATLTKKSAERLTDYLCDLGLKVKYLHADIDVIQRVRLLSELRKGEFDCIVGINLMREGIDMPEIKLVAILDADKEGFLRSARSLTQVAGRAARTAEGRVIFYAYTVTDSMKNVIETTRARREKQQEYNKKHGIVPKTIVKSQRETITDVLGLISREGENASNAKSLFSGRGKGGKEEFFRSAFGSSSPEGEKEAPAGKGVAKGKVRQQSMLDNWEDLDPQEVISALESEMLAAAEALEFERAALLWDRLRAAEKALEENGPQK
ncbi:MAG: UvrB/UvrC motif-containing protein, partial [Lentisphaeria bacterium]|nr:UvrB/UvrC motif-containing protein [Lentisphaeria bacterium]